MRCRHIAERSRLQNDIESLKELLHTYEESIERKDQVINNLTQGLQQQKAKHEMLRTFCEWKIRHNDVKREVRWATLGWGTSRVRVIHVCVTDYMSPYYSLMQQYRLQ